MGREVQQTQAWLGLQARHIFMVLLAVQSSAFVLLLHYSRVMPVVGGRRYFTSTAVFLNEVFKLTICLTVSLYEISKSAPPSMPATSLFGSLIAAIFSGDSWKVAVPAGLYTLANSLLYIALSNMEAPAFQATHQLKLVVAAVFGVILLRRNITYGKWISLLLLLGGVALVQIPPVDPQELDRRTHTYHPRLRARSATYEGIEDDIIQGHPHFNRNVGILAALGACIAAGLGSVSFEKVLKDSAYSTSIWIRNVQLAIYSIFPALFIGVVFVDGEHVAKSGFFQGYNWAVWTTIGVQAVGGIATSFCVSYAETTLTQQASVLSIILSTLASFWLFEFKLSATFLLGTLVVLAATYFYIQGLPAVKLDGRPRPPPIRIQSFEKSKTSSPGSTPAQDDSGMAPPNDFSIKLPTTPLIAEAALSTSRPGSPGHHARPHSSRGSYFSKQPQDES